MCGGRFCGRIDPQRRRRRQRCNIRLTPRRLRSVRCISAVEMLNLLKWHNNLTCTDNDLKSAVERHKLCNLETTRPNDSDNKWCEQCKSQNARRKNRAEKVLQLQFYRCLQCSHSCCVQCLHCCGCCISSGWLTFCLHADLSVNSELNTTLLWSTDRVRRVMLKPGARNSHSNSEVVLWCE